MKTTVNHPAPKGLKMSAVLNSNTTAPSARTLKQQLVSFKGSAMSTKLSGPVDHNNSKSNRNSVRDQASFGREHVS